MLTVLLPASILFKYTVDLPLITLEVFDFPSTLTVMLPVALSFNVNSNIAVSP